MAYEKRTWLQRIVSLPGRRRLNPTSDTSVYDVSRADGEVVQEGDAYSAENMNDWEDRIEAGFNEKLDKTSVVANLATTVAGSPLDATMGKQLNDALTALTASGVATLNTSYVSSASGEIQNVEKSGKVVIAMLNFAVNTQIPAGTSIATFPYAAKNVKRYFLRSSADLNYYTNINGNTLTNETVIPAGVNFRVQLAYPVN